MFEQWAEVELDLRVETTLALDAGGAPEPLLAAFDEDEALAVVALRPVPTEQLLQALVEVLALLLPLGACRVALALPGRVRRAGPPTSPGELAADDDPLVVLATASATSPERDAGGEVDLAARVVPLRHDGECWQWQEDLAVDIDAEDWDVTRALAVLLGAPPPELAGGRDERALLEARPTLQAQLARCLLLGHVVALAPAAADRLEPDRSLGSDTVLPTTEG